MLKKWRIPEMCSGILLLVFGLILLLRPEMTLLAIANAIGIVIIIIGVVFIIGYFLRNQIMANTYDLVIGLIILCIGIFIRVRSGMFVSILPVLLGIAVVISGLFKLQHAANLWRIHVSSWLRVGIIGLISVLIGLIVILNPFSTMAWLMRLVGIGLIYSGATDLGATLYVSKKMSDYYVEGRASEDDDF